MNLYLKSKSYNDLMEEARDKALCCNCQLPVKLARYSSSGSSWFHSDYPMGCLQAHIVYMRLEIKRLEDKIK